MIVNTIEVYSFISLLFFVVQELSIVTQKEDWNNRNNKPATGW